MIELWLTVRPFYFQGLGFTGSSDEFELRWGIGEDGVFLGLGLLDECVDHKI